MSALPFIVLNIGMMVRVFANGPGDLGSIPSRVIPKTQKMVLDAALLNTQHYKVRIKVKVEQSRERSSALLDFSPQLYLLPFIDKKNIYLFLTFFNSFLFSHPFFLPSFFSTETGDKHLIYSIIASSFSLIFAFFFLWYVAYSFLSLSFLTIKIEWSFIYLRCWQGVTFKQMFSCLIVLLL